jgi:hypothetical protein
MASIGPITFQLTAIAPVGTAQVEIDYLITGAAEDIAEGRRYQEVAQILSNGHRIGDPSLKHAVSIAEIPMPNGVIAFDGTHVTFPRQINGTTAMANLVQGTSPLAPEPLFIRVTLTPLPPTRDSNIVQPNPPGATT